VETPRALYIKLGEQGRWERESIDNGTMHLGYNDVPHELCVAGKWDEIVADYVELGTTPGVAARHMSQIRYFYTAPEETLWAAICFGRLYWCRARPEVTLLPDGSKLRHTVDGWRDTDAAGRRLDKSTLSGTIVSTEGFRGTICRFAAEDALLRRIAAEEAEEVVATREARNELRRNLEKLIRRLGPKDFELLIDLIFRGAGYQRVSELGAQLRDIDLDLISPLTNERVAVQVKSSVTNAELRDVEKELAALPDYSRLYVAVHSPSEEPKTDDEIIELLLPDRIADLALRYGLSNWLIDRAS
jgi:hypothetical protein